MVLRKLSEEFTVCKTKSVETPEGIYFLGKTDEEVSLVCETRFVPEKVTAREDGWKAFRIQGVLDFSLIGVLSGVSSVLAENKIGIFVVSTFNTDYVLVKKENFLKAENSLKKAGYEIE